MPRGEGVAKELRDVGRQVRGDGDPAGLGSGPVHHRCTREEVVALQWSVEQVRRELRTGCYPDRVFLRELKNYYAGCFSRFTVFLSRSVSKFHVAW